MVQSQSEMKRFKLKFEDAQARLKQKESHLKFVCEEFIASTSTSNVGRLFYPNIKELGVSQLSEEEQRKIHNAQKNKSKEEKEELIERLFLENIRLKREQAGSAEKE